MPLVQNVIAPLGPFSGIAGGVHLLITQNIKQSGWSDSMSEYVSILGMAQVLNLEPWITGDDYFSFEIYLNMMFNAAELALVWYNQAFAPFSTQWPYWVYPCAALYWDLIALIGSWFATPNDGQKGSGQPRQMEEDYGTRGNGQGSKGRQ